MNVRARLVALESLARERSLCAVCRGQAVAFLFDDGDGCAPVVCSACGQEPERVVVFAYQSPPAQAPGASTRRRRKAG